MTAMTQPLHLPLPSPAGRSRPAIATNAELAARRDLTDTLAIFYVMLDEPLISYRPGQYVSVGVQSGTEIIQRPYSVVALNVDATRIELFVRRLANGRFSNLLWSVPVGERVTVGKPKGLFRLDETDSRPRLMVGTGTGVAPLVAMLGSAARVGSRVPTVLIHGASFADELGYRERLAGLARDGLPLDYRPTVSRPLDPRNARWSGRAGRVEEQLSVALDEFPWLAGGSSLAYLCGNPEMILGCSELLRAARFGAADIRVESFHPPITQPRPGPRSM